MAGTSRVPVIPITGGPSGGKTTCMAYLVEKLSDLGYRVFVIPETATKVITGGVGDLKRLAEEDRERFLHVQSRMLLMQLSEEEHFLDLAAAFPDEKVVILCDRGAADVRAYVTKEEFRAFMDAHRLNWRDIRDHYAAAIHLVTAAEGASEFYTTANNRARHESPEEAIEADWRTRQAWVGAQHLTVVESGASFESKMHRTFAAVCRVLGIPVPIEIERKYLLRSMPSPQLRELREAVTVDIEQYYLPSEKKEESHRIRRRSFEGSAMHFETRKRLTKTAGVRVETERLLTPLEYVKLLRHADPKLGVIKKARTCFLYRGQYFELDWFYNQPKEFCLLEVELTEENQKVDLPPFLDIAEDVTDDPRYTNDMIAAGSLLSA